jgi:hypothetical protein
MFLRMFCRVEIAGAGMNRNLNTLEYKQLQNQIGLRFSLTSRTL